MFTVEPSRKYFIVHSHWKCLLLELSRILDPSYLYQDLLASPLSAAAFAVERRVRLLLRIGRLSHSTPVRA